MKNKKLVSAMASMILGVLLLFFGINCLQVGTGPMITLGVFGLLFGLGYIAIAALPLMKAFGKNELVTTIGNMYMVLAFPLFYFIETLMVMIMTGANNLAVVAWIVDITLYSVVALLVTAAILALVLKNSLFEKIKDYSLFGFLALVVLLLVFPQDGGVTTIGTLSLFELITVVSYALIGIDVVKDTLLQTKDALVKQTEEEKCECEECSCEKKEEKEEVKEEVPAEEVKEEAAPEQKEEVPAEEEKVEEEKTEASE